MEHTLSSLYWLFHDAPARREDFITITGSTLFPLKFCNHRWVENVVVAERALDIWPKVKDYIDAVQSGQVTEPKNKSFKAVVTSMNDPLFIPRLHAFLAIAKATTPFLTKYQTDVPMLPFLKEDLEDLLRDLLRRFVKKNVLEKVDTVLKLLRIDPTKQSLQVESTAVDVVFAAEQALRRLKASKEVNALDLLSVHVDVTLALAAMVKKLQEKCPLTHTLVRNLAWLQPHAVCSTPDVCVAQLKRSLAVLVNLGHVEESSCDDIIQEYHRFLKIAATSEAFLHFSLKENCLDELFFESLAKKEDFRRLWRVVRVVLLLSHGQATVEQGFSTNKEAMADNMAEHTLIGKRVVKDFLASTGCKVADVELTPPLLAAAASGRRRYHLYLEDEKRKREQQEKAQKRKADSGELEELRAKRRRLEASIKALSESADAFADDAERTGKVELISQSNSHRRSAKEKAGELKDVEAAISKHESDPCAGH